MRPPTPAQRSVLWVLRNLARVGEHLVTAGELTRIYAVVSCFVELYPQSPGQILSGLEELVEAGYVVQTGAKAQEPDSTLSSLYQLA